MSLARRSRARMSGSERRKRAAISRAPSSRSSLSRHTTLQLAGRRAMQRQRRRSIVEPRGAFRRNTQCSYASRYPHSGCAITGRVGGFRAARGARGKDGKRDPRLAPVTWWLSDCFSQVKTKKGGYPWPTIYRERLCL
jgi:hypothetical protein